MIEIYSLPMKTSLLHRFFDRIDVVCKNMSTEKRDAIKLVFEEAFVNIADYAYDKTEKKAHILFCSKKDSFSIIFVDRGPAFNPLEHPDPDMEKIEKEGGFGVFLIKDCSDDISYHRILGRNILKVTFFVKEEKNYEAC